VCEIFYRRVVCNGHVIPSLAAMLKYIKPMRWSDIDAG
jgi:hypothetical protein